MKWFFLRVITLPSRFPLFKFLLLTDCTDACITGGSQQSTALLSGTCKWHTYVRDVQSVAFWRNDLALYKMDTCASWFPICTCS